MSDIPRSADFLVALLLQPGVLDQVNAKPAETLRELAATVTKNLLPPVTKTDHVIYRIIVSALGIVAVAAIIGAIVLSAIAPAGTVVQIPDVLTALGAAAIGGMTGLLAPSPEAR